MGCALEGLLDLPASQATCADTDALGRTVDYRTDTLKIGVEGPFGLVVGMTDVMT